MSDFEDSSFEEGKSASEEESGSTDPSADEFDDRLPSSGLLSFYDRLRERIFDFVDRRGTKVGQRTAQALLLVPDVFILLSRLALDKEVPKKTRTLIASVLAYFVLPFDLMPEGVIGPAGYVDDLVLGLMVLSQAFSKDLEPFVEKHWSGSEPFRKVLRDVLGTAESLVGHNVYERLLDLLLKKGIDVREVTPK